MRTENYLIITPCRNEQVYIQKTIASVVSQTIMPLTWVIVDDGSTDDTPLILAKAAAENEFIEIVTLKDRGSRSVGPGVINAFYEGLNSVDIKDYAYICKLDADLSFESKYFETLISYMNMYPRLGNISGKTYIESNDKWISERMGDENAIGPSKFYRVSCFNQIGGFIRQVSWDGIDGHMCRMNDWIAISIDTNDLVVKHYRPQGSSQVSLWVGRKRWGKGKYFMGSSLVYVLAVSIYRMFERPYVFGGVGIFTGYLLSMIKRIPRFDDKQYHRYFRKYELESLIFGKKRTLRKYNSRIVAKYNLDSSILDYSSHNK